MTALLDARAAVELGRGACGQRLEQRGVHVHAGLARALAPREELLVALDEEALEVRRADEVATLGVERDEALGRVQRVGEDLHVLDAPGPRDVAQTGLLAEAVRAAPSE